MISHHRILGVLVLSALILQLFCGCGPSSEWKTVDLTKGISFKYRFANSETSADLNSVSMLDDGSGYIAGDKNVVLEKKMQGNWNSIGPPNVRNSYSIKDFNFTSVSALKNDSAWFAGMLIRAKESQWQERPFIRHYDGKTFSSYRPPTKAINPSIVMLSDSSGWAAGVLPGIWKYDKQHWNSFAMPTDSMIVSVTFKNDRKGWAIANVLFEYDNGTWQQIGGNFPMPMSSILAMNHGTILVGGIETLLLYSSFNTVVQIPGFAGRSISAMAECGGGAIVLVGGDARKDTGRIMFLSNDKKLASEICLSHDHYLTSISCDSSNHGWIVGHSGTLIEFRIDQ